MGLDKILEQPNRKKVVKLLSSGSDKLFANMVNNWEEMKFHQNDSFFWQVALSSGPLEVQRHSRENWAA
jgi:hypothetical protein